MNHSTGRSTTTTFNHHHHWPRALALCLGSVGRRLLRPVRAHLSQLVAQMDPLVEADSFRQLTTTTTSGSSSGSSARGNWCNERALALVLFGALYGTLGLPLEASKRATVSEQCDEGKEGLTASLVSVGGSGGLNQDPNVFTHRVAPRPVWRQYDLAIATSVLNTLISAVLMSRRSGGGGGGRNSPYSNSNNITCKTAKRTYWVQVQVQVDSSRNLRPRKRVCLGPDTDLLSQAESDRMLRTRAQLKLAYALVMVGLLCFAVGMFELQVMLSATSGGVGGGGLRTEAVFLNARTTLFWVVGFPLFLVHDIYYLFNFKVILCSTYLHLRQRMLCLGLEAVLQKRIIAAAAAHNNTTGRPTRAAMTQCWCEYLRLNRLSVQHCAAIETAGSSWVSRTLTILLPVQVSIQCYLLVALVLRYGQLPGHLRALLLLALVDLNLYLWAVVRCCASVGEANSRTERLHRSLYTAFFVVVRSRNNQNQSNHIVVRNVAAQLKADGFQAHRRFHRYCFKVGSYHRVNSRTYFLILSYIVAFMMFLIRDQYKEAHYIEDTNLI